MTHTETDLNHRLPTALEYVGALARVGANTPTIAERFGVSERWLRTQVQNNEDAATVWKQNKAADKLDVLLARKLLEITNAQVHIWPSKQKLGETETAQADIAHKHYVVGMRPDLNNCGGIKHDFADIDQETRVEVVETMAAIIRLAHKDYQ